MILKAIRARVVFFFNLRLKTLTFNAVADRKVLERHV